MPPAYLPDIRKYARSVFYEGRFTPIPFKRVHPDPDSSGANSPKRKASADSAKLDESKSSSPCANYSNSSNNASWVSNQTNANNNCARENECGKKTVK